MRQKLRTIHNLKKEYIIMAAWILIILAMVFPYIRSAAYSVFSGDDYSIAIRLKGSEVSLYNHFVLGIDMVIRNYFDWTGFYTSSILNAAFSPINILDMNGLSVLMSLNVLFYYLSIVVFIYILFRMMLGKNWVWGGVCVCIIYIMTAHNQLQESFYQFSCAITYTIPATFIIFGCSFFLLYVKNRKRWQYVVGIICGIVGWGGSLVDPALGCSIVLLAVLYNRLKEGTFNKSQLVFLGIWVLFSLINALAPGNMVRHGVIDDSGIHPIKALIAGVVSYEGRFQYYSTKTDWLVIMLILVVCGVLISEKKMVHKKEYAIVSVVALFIPMVVAFPVALGYSNFVYYSFPNRTVQIIDIAFLFVTANAAICVGFYLKTVFQERKQIICYLLIMIFLFAGIDGYSIRNNGSFSVFKRLRAGVYQTYNKEVSSLIKSLVDKKGEDVVITFEDYPAPIENFICYDLTEDSENRTNRNTAMYYGLNSIIVETKQ